MKTPSEFIGLDGKHYLIGQYGFKEIAAFIQWWRFKEYEELRNAAGENPVKEIREQLLKKFLECQDKALSLESEEVMKAMTTPAGIHKILYYSLKIEQPNIKEEDVSKIVGPINYEEILIKLQTAGGINLTMGETKGQSIKRKIMNLLTGRLFSNFSLFIKMSNQVKSQT